MVIDVIFFMKQGDFTGRNWCWLSKISKIGKIHSEIVGFPPQKPWQNKNKHWDTASHEWDVGHVGSSAELVGGISDFDAFNLENLESVKVPIGDYPQWWLNSGIFYVFLSRTILISSTKYGRDTGLRTSILTKMHITLSSNRFQLGLIYISAGSLA